MQTLTPSGTVATTDVLEGVEAFFVHIGPALAEQLLKTYHDGDDDYRKYLLKHGESIQRDMANDRWVFNGDTIVLGKPDENNITKLLDGQHRLTGVVKSGRTLVFLVVIGVDEATAYDTINSGVVRKLEDSFRRRKFTNVTLRSALVRILQRFESGASLSSTEKLTYAELNDVHDKYRKGIDRAIQLSTGMTYKIDIPSSLVAFSWWVFMQVDEEVAHKFMTELAEGEGIFKGYPTYTLRARLVNELKSDLNRHQYMKLVFTAFDAELNGAKITSLGSVGDGSRASMDKVCPITPKEALENVTSV